MAFEVMLTPDAAWKFYNENKIRCSKELIEIATNRETNTVVYLTEEQGKPYVVVERNEEEVYSESCVSEPDMEDTLRNVYLKWLPKPELKVHTKSAYDASNPLDMEVFREIADERNEELRNAFQDFICVVTGNDPYFADAYAVLSDDPDEIMDRVLEFIGSECGVSVYRPMVVFDEDAGCEVCTEYPYDEYVFGEDEETCK